MSFHVHCVFCHSAVPWDCLFFLVLSSVCQIPWECSINVCSYEGTKCLGKSSTCECWISRLSSSSLLVLFICSFPLSSFTHPTPMVFVLVAAMQHWPVTADSDVTQPPLFLLYIYPFLSASIRTSLHSFSVFLALLSHKWFGPAYWRLRSASPAWFVSFCLSLVSLCSVIQALCASLPNSVFFLSFS